MALSQAKLKFIKKVAFNMLNKTLILILSGIAVGLWVFLSEGTFFILSFALIIFFILKYTLPPEGRDFAFRLIIIGLALRIILAVGYYYLYLVPGNADILGPDGESYSQRGWYISRLLLGQNYNVVPNNSEYIFKNYNEILYSYKGNIPPADLYQVGIHSYFIAVLYAIYGYSPLMLRMVNSTLSILTAIMIFFLAREIFDKKIGKISMALLIFVPSCLIFSITVLRDPAIIFLLTLIVWLMLRFQNTRNIVFLILAFISVVLTSALRSAIILPLLLFMLLSLLMSLKVKWFKKIIIAVIIFFLLMSIPSLVNQVYYRLKPENFFSTHIGYLNTPGNNYRIFPERCYESSNATSNRLVGVGPLEVMQAAISGIMHLFGEPLPVRFMQNKGYIFIFFQTALFLLFMPFILLGLLFGLRYRAYKMIPVSIYLLIFIALIVMSEGNVGTVIRHRDMLIPFLIILGVAGCCAKLGKLNRPLTQK